jgi:hypothetical protein
MNFQISIAPDQYPEFVMTSVSSTYQEQFEKEAEVIREKKRFDPDKATIGNTYGCTYGRRGADGKRK